jgi:hypothetical protein
VSEAGIVRIVQQLLGTALVAGVAFAAGDVRVVASGGTLSVAGDALANAVRVRSAGAMTTFVVEPLDGSTTVNRAAGPAVVTGVTGLIRIELHDGSDLLVVEDAGFPGDLRIASGSGDDRVDLEHVTVAGTLRIETATGNDDVRIARASSVAGATIVSTGTGDDTIGTDGATFARSARFGLGAAHDVFALNYTRADAGVSVNGGGGYDIFPDGDGNSLSPLRLTGIESTP